MPENRPITEPAAAISAAARRAAELASPAYTDGQSATLNMTLLRDLAEKIARKRELDAQLEALKRDIDALQEPCIAELTMAGVERLPVRLSDESTMTLFVHEQLWARPLNGSEGRDAVVEALKEEGLEEFVKEDFNISTLSAWCREQERANTPLPERLLAVMDISRDRQVRGRAS